MTTDSDFMAASLKFPESPKNIITLPPQMKNNKLLEHQRLFNCADDIKSLKCFRCTNFQTNNVAHLMHHFQQGHKFLEFEEKLYDCENCSLKTYSNFLFLRHKLLNLCITVKSETTLPDSGGDKENDQLLQCQACNPQQCYHSKPYYKCYSCSLITLVKTRMNDHVTVKHKNELLKCVHCPYTTKIRYRLTHHILCKHTAPEKINWIECEQCSYKTKMKVNLIRHVYVKHSNPGYLCDICSYQTKLKQTLENHILNKHTEIERIQWFQCAQCPYKAKTKSNMKYHRLYNHFRKDMKCDQCPFVTKVTQVMKGHILTKHTKPTQWFKCGQCTYRSKVEANLSKHVDSKHNENKPFKCRQCSFGTLFKNALTKHISSKHKKLKMV